MAKRTSDEDKDRDLDEGEASSRDDGDEEEEAGAEEHGDGQDDSDEDESDSDDSDDSDSDESEGDEPHAAAPSDADSSGENAEDGDEEESLPAQLGIQRYVYAAAFSSILLGAYVFGRALDGLWQYASARDFVVLRAPWLASVPDESKANYSLVIGAVLALLLGLRTYRKPSIRAWSDEVTTELVKVKWPSRKDVINSTTVVLTTTAVAVVYLFLLDRFWGFVTGLIYGGGT